MNSPFTPRRVLYAAVGLAASIAASAQGPTMAVKVGANLSNLYHNEVNDNNARFGFDAGLMGRSAPDQAIGLQAELLYSTRGTETEYHTFFGLVDQTIDFNLNYIELPVMVSFRIADGAFEVQAGGYAAYLVNVNVTSNGDFGDGSDDLDKDNFNTVDAGLVGGLAFNSGPVQVGVRYDYGLTEIADSDDAKFLLGNAKNSCAQLYVALGMP
jgi:hypothetical protein